MAENKKIKLTRIDKEVLRIMASINHPCSRDEIAQYPSFLEADMKKKETDLIQGALDKLAKDGTYVKKLRDKVYGITEPGLLAVYKPSEEKK